MGLRLCCKLCCVFQSAQLTQLLVIGTFVVGRNTPVLRSQSARGLHADHEEASAIVEAACGDGGRVR